MPFVERLSPELDVATPQRVSLSFPLAGIGHRTLAYLVDLLLLFFGWVALYFLASLTWSDLFASFSALSGLLKSLLVLGVFLTQWVYWTSCELAFNGQTPGKRLLRIRVLRDDGSPL